MDPARLFTQHPASVGESYGEHLAMASGFGLRMVLGGLACLIHGLLPFLCVQTGSRQVALLHDRMVANRRRRPPVAAAAAPASTALIAAGPISAGLAPMPDFVI